MDFKVLQERAGRISREHGFWQMWDAFDVLRDGKLLAISTKLALTHSEISEALECIRDHIDPHHFFYRQKDGKPEGFKFEIADAAIRLMDVAEYEKIDLQAAIIEKSQFNESRPKLHGRNF